MKRNHARLIVLANTLLALSCASLSRTPPQARRDELEDLRRLVKEAWEKKDYAPAVTRMESFLSSPNAEKVPSLDRADIAYDLACGHALLNHPDAALTWLEKAADWGFNSYVHLQQDTDLSSVQHEPRFAAVVARVKEVGDYVDLLRRNATYNEEPLANPPVFIYQSAQTPELRKLRELYQLDRVAGTGDEFSQVVNLMRWVHQAVRHDGNTENPSPRNALNLIEVCRREKRGINCRGMATILNEFYLAMGFPSRHITAMPKATDDPDCHVVNIVYLRSLGQWVMMDPTFAAFVTDENGKPLSVSEFRERLASGAAVRLNPEANWNGERKDPQEYLDYMAKNLFHFQCPLESTFGFESRSGSRNYVQLDPLPAKASNAEETKDGAIVTRTITNASVFWAPPPMPAEKP